MEEKIRAIESLEVPELPDAEDESVVTDALGTGSSHRLLVAYNRLLESVDRIWQYHFEFLNLGYAAYLVYYQRCKQAFPDITDQAIAQMVSGIDVVLFRPDEELQRLMVDRSLSASPQIVLVPGFWLGAWAWGEVAAPLRTEGHEVLALTLPGLESVAADRSSITFADHVDAICDAVTAAAPPAVLAVHSGAGAPGYAATDRIPEQIAHMVYVDSGPATGALDPSFDGAELPLPSPEALAAEENLDGLSEEQLEIFRRRAVPQPGAALRDAAVLTNDARLDVPSTIICTGFPSEQVQAAVKEGYAWLGGLAELRDVTYVDLPTSHWPMWSRPRELAEIIGDIARRASGSPP